MPLDLSKVDDKKHLIESLTDHFTDIINATITVPDHPQETSFNPNQIKDIKAADPGGEINLIEPPQADNQGNAKLSYPIEAPPGRHGLQPQLSVAYNSDGGNSWMGVGWDLSMQQITVESRWGVPRYISGAESETYLLNGEMLVEETSAGPYLAHRAASFLSPRLSGSVTFHTRVEGQFRRIVRKGTNPQDYRWEVTDKTGMTSYFGGTSSGPDGINSGDTTRLGTDGGNVYMWALKEIRDLNHNFMRYHYQVVNSSPGRQLYMSNITYTGNGSSEGSYGVSFIRDSQASIGARPDSIINAKGGFLQVTADRLHVIEVKLNSNLIRRYKFTYDVGPFNKSRLVKIEQFGSDGTPFAGNIHTFEYFNENVKASDGNYNGYDSAQSWSPFDDGSKAGIPILDDDSSSSLSGSIGDSIGGSAYVGFGPIVPPFKDQSAGPKFGFNHSDSFGLLYMTPLSGTGLPDKVYRKGSNVYFRPNLSGPGSSANDISLSNAQRTFGDNSHVDGLHDLSKEFSDTISAGGESYFGIPIIGNVSFTFSEGKAYFLDVNSDGIPDMVKEGQVYFGHRRLNGTVFYDQDSTTTPNPLVIGSSISSSMFESFEPQHQQKIDMSPMVDTLRRWVAPFNGIIDITAPVSLLQPPALSPDDDPRTDDGVKVSIELDHTGSSPVVLKTVLLKGDTSTGGPDYGAHNDLSISGVHVVQGDRIYFRLQSGDDTASDGTFDQVGWDPQIDYSNVNGHSLPVPQDANNLDPASYQVSKDFTFAGLRQAQTGLGFDGTIRLSGDLVKSDTTTDDITLVISLVSGGVTTVLNAATPNQTLTWDQTGTIGVSSTGAAGGNRDIVVHAHDFLILQVLADSNVDLTKLTFKPLVYYIASTDPKLPSTALFHPITNEPQTKIDMPYDIEFYPDNKLADPQAPITVVRPEFPIPTPIPVYPAPPAFPPNTDPPDTQMTPIPSGEGLLRSQSTLTKNGVTSTDVVITVYAKIPPSTIEVPVFTQTVSSGFTGNMDIAGVFDQLVKTGTTLRVHVDVGTQTDLNKIVWNPTFYYVNPFPPVFTSPPAQAGKISGPADLVTPYCGSGSCTPVIIHTPYDIDLTSTGPLVTRVRYLNVIPSVNVTAGTTGSLIFTIKNGVERLFKESIDLSNVQTDFVTVNVGVVPPLEVTLGDHLYSSFTARDKSLRTKFTATLTGFYGGDRNLIPDFPMPFTVDTSPDITVFAVPYRGWAVAGYNGNRSRNAAPVDESLLALPSSAPSDFTDPSNASNMKAYFFIPDAIKGRWRGPAGDSWAAAISMSSTRAGEENVDVPDPSKFGGSGTPVHVPGIIRLSNTTQGQLSISAPGGVLPSGFDLGAGVSRGGSAGTLDFNDLNGDGYPDVVGNKNVQYTLPNGGLDSQVATGVVDPNNVLTSQLRSSDLLSGSVNADASSIPGQNANGKGRVPPLTLAQVDQSLKGFQMQPLGFNGSLGLNQADEKQELMDVNGDGLPDILTLQSIGGQDHLMVRYNLGYKFTTSAEDWGVFKINSNQGDTESGGVNLGFNVDHYSFAGGLNVNVNHFNVSESLVDLNGDGLPDHVRQDGGTLRVSFNTGHGFTSEVKWQGGSSDISKGEGNSLGAGVYATIYIPIPIPFAPFKIVINFGFDGAQDMSRQRAMFQDINGDGYPDQLTSDKEGDLTAHLNKTGKTNLLKVVHRPLGATITLDYKRNGNTFAQPHSHWDLAKVVVFDGGQNQNTANTFGQHGADYQVTKYSYFRGLDKQVPAQPINVYDRFERDFLGYGAVTETQMDTTDLDGSSLDSATPYRRVIREYLNTNIYEKGLMTKETTDDVTAGLTSPSPFLEADNTYQLVDVDAGGTINQSDISLHHPQQVIFPQAVTMTKKFFEGGTGEIDTFQTFTYDQFGNVVNYFDNGNSNDAGTQVMATISYLPDGNPYLAGLPTTILVTDNTNTTLRRREAVYDISTGNLKIVRQYIDGTHTAETVMTYDNSNGNLLTTTAPANLNNQNYQLNYLYDTTVQTYPALVTDNPLHYTSSMAYDLRFGKPVSQVDENSKLITMTYDPFGRTVTIVGPFETGPDTQVPSSYTIAFDYHPDVSVPYAHTAHFDNQHPGDPIETILFTDGLKRVIQTKKDDAVALSAGVLPTDVMTVSGRVVFDQVGRTIQQYYPITEPKGSVFTENAMLNINYDSDTSGVPPTAMTYDTLDRNTRTTIPDNTFMTIDYAIAPDNSAVERFHTLVTDAKHNKKNTYRDVRELITSVVEHNPSTAGQANIITKYEYDPIKQITHVKDAGGNKTLVSYDLLGRRTSIDNPDTGLVTTKYDAASNVISKQTANLAHEHKFINYDYDANNRLTSIKYPDNPGNNVTYTYGGPSAAYNGANRITLVKDASGTEQRQYDALGNIIQETKTLPPTNGMPTSSYTTAFQYDTWNRMMAMLYPDGERVTYGYDSGGLVNKVDGDVSGVHFPYVQRLEYDKFEQRIFVQNGNGTKSTYQYNADNRRLHNLLHNSSVDGIFQNLTYTYDVVGNITDLDNPVPITSRDMGGPVKTHYGYDDLYRLTSAVGHFRGTGDAKGWKSDYTLKMDYDTIHNITEKNQHVTGQFTGDTPKDRMKGTYDYNYKYTGTPHAPTVIGNRSFTYDLNGNQLGFEEKGHGSDRTISWDEENRIQSIKDGSQQGGKSTTTGLTFQYDDAGQRIIKEQGEDTTAYINQFFTVKQPMKNSGAIESKHIFAGSTRILTQIVHGEGSAAVAGGGSGASSTSSSSSSTGITHGHGVHSTNHGAKNNSNGNGGGGLGNNTGTNFVTITTDTPVFEGSSLNSQTLGNVVQCDVLTLLTLTPDNQGFYKVEFGGKVGFVPAADAVVGTSPSCEGTSGSVLPKDNFIFYYHTDHLGSTGYMTDWQGKVRENLQYTPFGETWIEQRRGMKIFPDFEFTSKILDSETGLYYYGARYYDPRTSVWQSADPALLKFLPGAKIKYVPKFEREPNWKWVIGLPGEGGVFEPSNLGLFSYAGNNPLKYADPNGEYILSASFMAAYPNASKEIIKLITKLNKLKLEVYKQVTGASAKEVKTAMTEGKGPIITGSFIPKSSEAPNGAYGQQIDSVLMLDIKSTLDKYEKGEISTKLFDATVEHETAHYLAQKHGLEDSSEKGKHERGNDYEMGVYKEITNESNSPVEKEKDK